MRRIWLAAAFGVMAHTAADAQSITIRSQDRGIGAAGDATPTRLQVQMNISQRLTANTIEEQRRGEEIVRRSLYEMAMNECKLIGGAFRMECRLASLNVNSNAVERNDSLVINGSATGQYELVPQP